MSRVIEGNISGKRLDSRILDLEIREAIRQGSRELRVIADGQHGIGGRLWGLDEPVTLTIEGPVGQRVGGMGVFGTTIVVRGNASDDVGWLNCGADITVLGDVTNGAHNAAAQGRLYVLGSGGARCDTMTKHNPKFRPPQSWYFRDVGDAFAEFKAGGIAVVCGVNPRDKGNILGYRPCIGMVGGVVYFRGPTEGYSEKDVQLLDLTPQDWEWLKENMGPFLKAVGRENYYGELTGSAGDWKKLLPYTAQERARRKPLAASLKDFRESSWEKGLGQGGLFADYIDHEQTVLPYITTGTERRYVPLWSNHKYTPPCEYNCPSGIPTWKRAQLIRAGRIPEALELALRYTPLPATVCGEICAHLCMGGCTRGRIDRPLSTEELGRASLAVNAPMLPRRTGKRVAVIGSGAGGMSVSWQLALRGHEVHLYEAEEKIGGKLEYFIPRARLPQRVLKAEIERFAGVGIRLHTGRRIGRMEFDELARQHDAVVVAVGTHKPRNLGVEGSRDMETAYDFLKRATTGRARSLRGKRVVVIGAGNVGMDVAAEAYRLGAATVTAIDIRKPAAFGKELELARSLGTEILWPLSVEKYAKRQKLLSFTDGTARTADLVVAAIGDAPDTDFLPPTVHTTSEGWIAADEAGHTSEPRVFAIGDVVGPGLATHAIGHGRLAAEAVHAFLTGRSYYRPALRPVVPYERIKTAYYETSLPVMPTVETEANRCLSCGACRDCHMCEQTCYQGAISRRGYEDGSFEYVVNPERCIGCGFCAGVCPTGVWELVENR